MESLLCTYVIRLRTGTDGICELVGQQLAIIPHERDVCSVAGSTNKQMIDPKNSCDEVLFKDVVRRSESSLKTVSLRDRCFNRRG